MPRPLTIADNQFTLNNWLQMEISNMNAPFTPHISPVNVIPENRGIYFWFMEPKGYEKLSRYVQISPVENRISWQIDGKTYDLVYLGTAGTNRDGLQTIRGRLKWHIHQKHSENAICNGSISTLRAGLASLLSDDLILPNSEELVNEIMRDYFKIFWVGYIENNLIEQVDTDEEILIKTLRPLLNIKNNPNARIIGNPTQIYKERRNLIINSTKARLGCKKKQEGAKTSDPGTPVITNSGSDCVEFTISHTESVHNTIQNVQLPPADKYQVEIFNQIDKTDAIFTGRTSAPKQYFNRVHSNNIVRWRHIQTIMNDRGIKNATVLVCPLISNTRPSKVKVSNKTSPILPSSKNKGKMKNFKLKNDFELRGDDIIVMCCASKKRPIELFSYNNQNIDFKAVANPLNSIHRPCDQINPDRATTWSSLIESQIEQNNPNNNLIEAYALYQNPIYRGLFQKFGDNLYILSAGWGLISAKFRIPKYDITFSISARDPNIIRPIQNPVWDENDFKQIAGISPNQRLIFIGGKDYIHQFIRITSNLMNQKIIVCKNLHGIILPNQTFVPFFYNTNTRTNWHYEPAKDLLLK